MKEGKNNMGISRDKLNNTLLFMKSEFANQIYVHSLENKCHFDSTPIMRKEKVWKHANSI